MSGEKVVQATTSIRQQAMSNIFSIYSVVSPIVLGKVKGETAPCVGMEGEGVLPQDAVVRDTRSWSGAERKEKCNRDQWIENSTDLNSVHEDCTESREKGR